MAASQTLKQISGLSEKIERLKIVKCRFNHERILYDEKSRLPVAGVLPELGYRNVGFCPAEIRRERLACGHTMARYLLEDALALLASNGVDTESLHSELRDVTNRIHTLDHEKGFAEKRLARLIEKSRAAPENDLTAEIEKAKTEIENIGDLHDECVAKIGRVRDSVVFEMRSLAGIS